MIRNMPQSQREKAIPAAKPSSGILLEPGLMSQVQETITAPQRLWFFAFGKIDSSLRAHARIWTYALVTAGLLVRIWHASGTFLNPDEAMHFAAANQDSWWLTYKASLILAHPPLLIFLLHVWRHIGTSELVLRLPSILAGTAFCWLMFRWASLLFEPVVAWTVFVLALFLPFSIQLSTEVRQYALLLAFAMAAAYLLEIAFPKRSVLSMLFSGVSLCLALLSHFSAFLFAAALGSYAIWRMVKERIPLRVFAAWECGQVVAIGLSYFLYVTQIFQLEQVYRGFSLTQGFMGSGYLAKYYFVRSRVNPFAFIFARSGGFFQFAFQQLVAGDVAFLLFMIGVTLVFGGRFVRVNSKAVGFLLVIPFALNCFAALVRAYPYGGTRHSAFLLPFAIAGVSVALGWISRNRLTASVVVAVCAVILCVLFPAKQFAEAPPGSQRIENMKDAMSFLQQVPADEPIFADVQSSLLLGYYLCEQRPIATDQSRVGFVSYECGGHRIISARQQYVFTAGSFRQDWQNMVRAYKLRAGTKVWIAQMGSQMHLERELEVTGALNSAPRDFGSEISFFSLTVGESTPSGS